MKSIFSVCALLMLFSGGSAFGQDQKGEQTLKGKVVEAQKPAAAPAATSAAAPIAAASGAPSTTLCTQGKATRRVELTFGAGGKPCEVHYKKETEQAGHDQVIYRAENDMTFCESKTQAFVDKLSGMGWACARQ